MSFLLLLPPSEGKSSVAGAGSSFSKACPLFAAEVLAVLKQLKKLRVWDRAAFYGVSSKEKALAAHALNLAALETPGMAAIERYVGVVYQYLSFSTLPDQRHASEHIFILSGLYGLIPATAPIADYKLPLNAWLTKHWKARNAARLERLAAGRPILSLLPGAHAKALGVADVLTVDFKLAGGKKSAGHFGKAIKGKFARYVLEHQVGDIAGVARFSADGYVFDGENFVQS